MSGHTPLADAVPQCNLLGALLLSISGWIATGAIRPIPGKIWAKLLRRAYSGGVPNEMRFIRTLWDRALRSAIRVCNFTSMPERLTAKCTTWIHLSEFKLEISFRRQSRMEVFQWVFVFLFSRWGRQCVQQGIGVLFEVVKHEFPLLFIIKVLVSQKIKLALLKGADRISDSRWFADRLDILVVKDRVFFSVFTDCIDADQIFLCYCLSLFYHCLVWLYELFLFSLQQKFFHSLWVDKTFFKILTTIVHRETVMLIFFDLDHAIKNLDRKVCVCFEVYLRVLHYVYAFVIFGPLGRRFLSRQLRSVPHLRGAS